MHVPSGRLDTTWSSKILSYRVCGAVLGIACSSVGFQRLVIARAPRPRNLDDNALSRHQRPPPGTPVTKAAGATISSAERGHDLFGNPLELLEHDGLRRPDAGGGIDMLHAGGAG